MKPIEQLIVDLAQTFPARYGREMVGIAVDEVVLDLPIEARLDEGCVVDASLPRGNLATGFDPPLGRLRLLLVPGGGE